MAQRDYTKLIESVRRSNIAGGPVAGSRELNLIARMLYESRKEELRLISTLTALSSLLVVLFVAYRQPQLAGTLATAWLTALAAGGVKLAHWLRVESRPNRIALRYINAAGGFAAMSTELLDCWDTSTQAAKWLENQQLSLSQFEMFESLRREWRGSIGELIAAVRELDPS